jgi:hypothetical protein
MLAVGLILALTKWQGPFISAWGVKYLPHHLAQLFFNTVFTIIFILLIYSFWRLIARRRQVQSSRSLILVHLSLFIFLITGFIDELGLAIGWTMSLFRLMMLAAILLAYFCWPKRVVT